ncbi:hypothetical protein LOC51_00555 [Rubrivivax sp. JA1024]|nr:hypothetical protein [Rubrivivax sp. JA1024]
MDIDTGGAAAPTEPVDATVAEEVVTPPNPISTESEAAAAPEPKGKTPSIDEALDRAAATVEAKTKSKAEGKGDEAADASKPARAEDGRFAAKEPAKDAPKDGAKNDEAPKDAAKPAPKSNDEAAAKAPGDAAPSSDQAPKPSATEAAKHPAPARFSNDAKAVWDAAPEPVRAEVARMERELSAGIEKYRTRAERDEQLEDFHQLASRSGTDVKTALTKYTNMEALLRQNPLRGLEEVCANIGVSLKDVAQIVLGQTPDQERSQAEATIRDLRNQVAGLQEQIAGMTDRFAQQDQRAVEERVAAWAADKPLFEVLAPHIAQEMQATGGRDLDQAYQAVLQKHPQLAALASPPPAEDPATIKPAASEAPAAPDPEAQTRKGSKSITGAPSAGSTPGAKRRLPSIDEAIDAAFAAHS